MSVPPSRRTGSTVPAPDWDVLTRLVRRIVARRAPSAEVDDLVQTTLRDLVQRVETEPPRHWRRFAARVAANVCSTHHRQRYGGPDVVSLDQLGGARAERPAARRGRTTARIRAIRLWIRDVLVPRADSGRGAASLGRGQRALLRTLASDAGKPRPVNELARELGCQPQHVRRRLLGIARWARFLGVPGPPGTLQG